MKRIRSKFIRLAVIALGIASAHANAITAFACEPEWGALLKALAPNAKVIVATSAYLDPHYIEARPSLISALRSADIAVCTGAGLEVGWLPVLLKRASNPAIQQGQPGLVYASQVINTIDKHETHFLQTGHVHPEGNPHFHLDPKRLMSVAALVTERLIEIDAQNGIHYLKTHQQWHTHWLAQIAHWQQLASPLRDRKVVSQHSSFDYLWHWLGMQKVADLEPQPGVPPTLSHLNELVSTVKQERPIGIVSTWYQSPKSASWLSDKTGVPALSLPATVSDQNESATLEALFNHLISELLSRS